MSNFKNYINVYEFNCELPGSGKVVNYKPITTGQMKKLLIYENETSPVIQEKALDDLISSSVIDEDFNINDLYLEDRFFLLVEMRKNTKGKTFKFDYNCPKCKTQTPQKINLDSLNVIKKKKSNPLIKLTDAISVEVKHIKRSEQKELEKYLDLSIPINETKKEQSKREMQQMVEMQLLGYADGITKIITPDGEEEAKILDKKWMLENTPPTILDKLKEWYNDNAFGVDFTYKVNCINCKHSEIQDIPLNNFFF